MSPLGDLRNQKDIVGRMIRQFIQQTPSAATSSQEKENSFSCEDVVTEKMKTPELEDMPTAPPAAANIDELSTQIGLNAVYVSSTSSTMPDGSAIDESPTWIIPVTRAHGDKKKSAKSGGVDSEVKNHISFIRNLIKSSGLYAVSSLAGPVVSLVLAPFLTHSLSRADYGALTVLNTVIALIAGITQVGLGSAFFRAYSYDYESQHDRMRVLSTAVVLLSITSAPTTVTALIAAPWLADLLFRTPSLSAPVQVAALVVLLQNLTVPGLAWLRAESRAAVFSGLSIVNLLVSLGANLVLVGALHMGVTGSLLATGASYAVVMLCTLPVILLRAGLYIRFDITWNLLSFGFPLLFNFLSSWVLQLSDRYLLSRFGSLAQTASYGVAYTLGGALGAVILSPFNLAWPTTMFAVAKRKDAAQVFQLIFRWYSIALLFATFALSLVAIAALDMLFPPAYHPAAPVIPIVATSIMFSGIFTVFDAGVGIQRKNWFSVLFLATAALANLGANLILIPLYGSMGAAVSTLLAYMILVIMAYIVNQHIYPVPFEIGMFSIALLVGIILYVGSGILAQTQTTYMALGICSSALVLYGGCLVVLGKFSHRFSKYRYRQVQED